MSSGHDAHAAVPRSLLVLRLSALGDVIHTIPAVVAIRDAWPETTISWVVEAPYAELVEIVAGVTPVPVRLKKWGRSMLRSRRDIGQALRTIRGADASIDFQGLMKSSMIGFASGAKRRIGFASGAIREEAALLFSSERVDVDTSRHVIEQNLELATALLRSPYRIDPAPAVWQAFPRGEGLEEYAGAIVLLPGTGKPNKIWPSERFRELAAAIGPRALAVWGPGERELAEATGARLAPNTNLRELAWLLANAAAVVGGDTGPLHLAAALGTPVVGLYGPTDPRRNGPYGQIDHCIDRYQSTKLMESISVGETMTMLSRVMA